MVSFTDLRWTVLRQHPHFPHLAVLCRMGTVVAVLLAPVARWWRSMLIGAWSSRHIHVVITEQEVASAMWRAMCSVDPNAWPVSPPPSFAGQDADLLPWSSPVPAPCFARARLPPLPGPTPLWHGATSAFAPVPFPGPLRVDTHHVALASHPLGEWLEFSILHGFSLSSDTPAVPRSARNALRGGDDGKKAQMLALAQVEVDDGCFVAWPEGTPTAPSQLRYLSFFGVPKTPTTLRGVSDQSGGVGSVNSFTHRPSCVGLRLASFHRILTRITWMQATRPGVRVMLAKFDAVRGFRNCVLPVADYHHSAYAFGSTTYIDVRLMMGAAASGDSMSAAISVVRDLLASRHGTFTECYVDDVMFVLWEDTAEAQLATARALWESLGWRLNMTKHALEGAPTTSKVFLGLLVNTETNTVSVDDKRRAKLLEEIESWLAGEVVLTPRHFARLSGRLAFVSAVVPFGKTFCRSLYSRSSPESLRWLADKHTPRVLHRHVRADLEWWRGVLRDSRMVASFGTPVAAPPPPSVHLFTDASGAGWGAYCPANGEFVHGPWRRPERNHTGSSTAMWEAMAILFAAVTWARLVAGGYMVIHSDSMACVRAFTRGYCENERMYTILRVLSLVQLVGGFRIVFVHVPGVKNDIADALSRCFTSLPLPLVEPGRCFFSADLRNLSETILRASPSPLSPEAPPTTPPSTTGVDTVRTWITPSPLIGPWTPWSATPTTVMAQ